MKELRYCTIKLDNFSVMNLIYPYIFSVLGIFVIGIPIGILSGVMDTFIFKNGKIVNIAFAVIGVLWFVIIATCIYSFAKVINDISKTVDALCIGDGKQSNSILVVFVLNMVTFGIYKFIYFYKMVSRLEEASKKYDTSISISPQNHLIFTILASVVGIGFLVGCGLIIEDVNKLATISNQENEFETDNYQNMGIKNIMIIFNNAKTNFKKSK